MNQSSALQLSDFGWSGIITKVVSAIIILVVTWFVAKLVKSLLTKFLGKLEFLHRQAGSGDNLAESLASIASLIIWLFGLMAVLNLFALTQVLGPMQNLLSGVLGAIPKIVAAGLILFIGFVLAKIVRELVVTALQAANVDERLARVGGNKADTSAPTSRADGSGATSAAPASTDDAPKISTIVGQVLYAVILLVVVIAALGALDIRSISDPATQLLSSLLNALPAILGAGILLAIGVVIARFVGDLLAPILRGLGLNRLLDSVGVDAGDRDVPAIVARVVQIAIVLFFAIAAANLLHFPQVTAILNTVLALGGRVVFGAIVIAAGVFIANLLARAMGGGQTAQIVRYATVVLFVAMGLKYMGLADSIVNLAFGAVVVGGAAAAALAFGLGGRDAAGRQLDKLQREQQPRD
ncbi:mechanosensitive ion channel [Allobranchiibius sp. CTAmp26]|uniref:mechanosensitive ion channel n=1 Tax=Allobranchiibius sp. CTAmp26 TaxID=2815214 RepID=UPI001AA10793|nr:mechanosensitive ion channel [Allobranchiibius sp. CTAmp26]MBO1756229.1 mechanosensitive ion channel [Allobranchiibius sp. CTAmp26]